MTIDKLNLNNTKTLYPPYRVFYGDNGVYNIFYVSSRIAENSNKLIFEPVDLFNFLVDISDKVPLGNGNNFTEVIKHVKNVSSRMNQDAKNLDETLTRIAIGEKTIKLKETTWKYALLNGKYTLMTYQN